MNSERITKVFSIGVLVGGIVISAVSYVKAGEEPPFNIIPEAITQPQTEVRPKYVPGEALVKFKEGAEPQSVLYQLGLEAKNIERTHPRSAEVAKYRKALKEELEPDAEGWYWFRGKQYKEAKDIEDEKLFKEAYQQMSPTRQALYRKYKITFEEETDVEEVVKLLGGHPDVEFVSPNYIGHWNYMPGDGWFRAGEQWALHNTGQEIGRPGNFSDPGTFDADIDAPEAWDITRGSSDIIIAILDTGVDYLHGDLANNMWVNDPPGDADNDGEPDDDGNGYIDDVHGFDFFDNDSDPMDPLGHGTRIAGIAAADRDNGSVVGVAPGCRIMALRIGYRNGPDVNGFERALKYAVDEGADVINISFSILITTSDVNHVSFADEIRDAYAHNVVLVAAVGQEDAPVKQYPTGEYPAVMDEVIAVANTDNDNYKQERVNFGNLVDVSAPGVNILTTRTRYEDSDRFDYYSGTSYACPFVAGVAALLLSVDPNLTAAQVKAIIKTSATGVPISDEYIGQGIINAYEALRMSSVPNIVAEITEPGYGDEMPAGTAVPIRGTATGGSWVVEYTDRGPYHDGPWQNYGKGPMPVVDGHIVNFDTTAFPPGAYFIKLTVTEQNGHEINDVTKVILTNDPPAFNPPLTNRVVNVGQPLEFFIAATDPNGDSLSFPRPHNLPGDVRYVRHGQGSMRFSWIPGQGQVGDYELAFTVSDGTNSVSETIIISVVDTNHPPVLTQEIGDKVIAAGQSLNFPVGATDADGDRITFHAYIAGDLDHDDFLTPMDCLRFVNALNNYLPPIRRGGPGWDPEMDVLDNDGRIGPLDYLVVINMINAGMTRKPAGIDINNAGIFSWSPDVSQVGTHRITIVASDGMLADAETFVITVEKPPRIRSVSPGSATHNNRNVAIEGENFGNTKSRLSFEGGISSASANIRINSWNDKKIAIDISKVPGGKYDVAVETDSGRSNVKTLRILPTIRRMWPYWGQEGRRITIDGKKFGKLDSQSQVEVYGRGYSKSAEVVSWDDNDIIFKIPHMRRRWRWYRVKVKTSAGTSNYRWLYVY